MATHTTKRQPIIDAPRNDVATITNGSDHVEALSHALAAFGSQVREGIEIAEECGDAGTADLLTAMAEEVEKQLWFVEAHQQAKS